MYITYLCEYYSNDAFNKTIPLVPNLLNENENDTHEKPAKLEAETSHQISTAEVGPYMMADLGNNVSSINSKSYDQSLHPSCTYEMVGSLQPVQLSSAINKLPTTQEVRYMYIYEVKSYTEIIIMR